MVDINYRVIALDPGGTTGWATYSAHWDKELNLFTTNGSDLYPWACGQLEGKHHSQLEHLLGLQHVQHYWVVCERFDDRSTGHAVNLVAREYIGVVERFCQDRHVPMVRQLPATAKGFVKNQNLKNLDLWDGVKWKHAMDARRHLLWYLIHGEPHRYDLLQKGWPNG